MPLVEQLGVRPILGRWFRDRSGVVISSALWHRLGSDPAIIVQPLTLDGRSSFTVTGVMPGTFHLPVAGITSVGLRADVWMPLDPQERAGAAYVAYARLKPGVSFQAAEDDTKRQLTDNRYWLGVDPGRDEWSKTLGKSPRVASGGTQLARAIGLRSQRFPPVFWPGIMGAGDRFVITTSCSLPGRLRVAGDSRGDDAAALCGRLQGGTDHGSRLRRAAR